MGKVSCTSFHVSPLGRRYWSMCVLSVSGERFCNDKAFAVHMHTNVTLRSCFGDWAIHKDTWPRKSWFLLIFGLKYPEGNSIPLPFPPCLFCGRILDLWDFAFECMLLRFTPCSLVVQQSRMADCASSCLGSNLSRCWLCPALLTELELCSQRSNNPLLKMFFKRPS